MYYLTVDENDNEICSRKPFDDYGEALEACAQFFKPKSNRSVLSFTTETINGKFARSYTELKRPEHISAEDEIGKQRYAAAAKSSNSFEYDCSYFFLIESELGIKDCDDEDE
jgi:hypothetical protein